MSHDLQAAWATSEVTYLLTQNQNSFFGSLGTLGQWSLYTGRDSKKKWPLPDGVIIAENASSNPIKIALEYKRSNEGLHGILTALGQSLAYIEKGYSASAIVIPEVYDSHNTPGQHIKRILDATISDIPILIYTYTSPNTETATPFRDRIYCVRDIKLKQVNEISDDYASYTKTLWMHLREGSSDPDAFFKYCQISKKICVDSCNYKYPTLPDDLIDAVEKLAPGSDPYKYLSNTIGDSLMDLTWREFWFRYVFWSDAIPLYSYKNNVYIVNETLSRILRSDNIGFKAFNVGKSNSPKNIIVNKLKSGEIGEPEAWREYSLKIRSRAHSYREDIDSGLDAIGFLSEDGRPTELGYKFVDACERTGYVNEGLPKAIFASSILANGQLGAFLYYIYKLSEQKFSSDPFAFTEIQTNKNYKFKQEEYKQWLEDKFQNELFIIRKVSLRGGQSRKPFQAEFAILKNLGFIKNFRIGVGLEINWPSIQESMNYFNSI